MVTVVIILNVMVFYCKRGKNKVKAISTEQPRQKQITPPYAKPKEQQSTDCHMIQELLRTFCPTISLIIKCLHIQQHVSDVNTYNNNGR